MKEESKRTICKTVVSPVMTCAAEARADTNKTMQMRKTVEMIKIREIQVETLRDQIISEQVNKLFLEKAQ